MHVPPDLEAFLAAERPRLVAAIDLVLGDHALAEEVVQEACVRAASRWARVRTLDSPGGWTYRVARNLATSSLRRRRVERKVLHRLPRGSVTEDPDAADRIAVRAALLTLPVPQREALVLRYYLGLDGPAIATRMGRSHAAVRALLTRGVAALRAQLGPSLGELVEAPDVR